MQRESASVLFTIFSVPPQYRLKKRNSSDPVRLDELVKEGKVKLTPCKNLQGKKSMSYDDRLIMQMAESCDAAIISNDNYVDLMDEDPSTYSLSKYF